MGWSCREDGAPWESAEGGGRLEEEYQEQKSLSFSSDAGLSVRMEPSDNTVVKMQIQKGFLRCGCLTLCSKQEKLRLQSQCRRFESGIFSDESHHSHVF